MYHTAIQPKVVMKGNHTLILLQPPVIASTYPDGIMWVDGVTYTSMRLPNDKSWLGTCGARSAVFAEGSDSVFVLSGNAPGTITQIPARARITSIANPDSTELAISFHKPVANAVTGLRIKDMHLNDTVLYLLMDGLTTTTTVEVVLNNGTPQAGTAITTNGAGLLKIDRSTGAIIKQVYFNHNPNDGWLNLTHFNNESLMKQGNRFFFTSVSSLNENFMLHIYDMNLNRINDIPIATEPYKPGNSEEQQHFWERVMGYGVHQGQEYLGLIPKTVPVVINLSTLNVHQIDAVSFLGYASASAVLLEDSTFFFFGGSWIKRVELNTMTPSVIRKDWVTNSPTLDGKGTSFAQRYARKGNPAFLKVKEVNGQIEYYASTRIGNSAATNGLFINGELITTDSIPDFTMVYKGNLGLLPQGPPGTETDFVCDNCVDTVRRIGNRVIYPIDSANVDSVCIRRITGSDNIVIMPSDSAVVDFSSDTNIVVFSLDELGLGDLTTVLAYVESTIVTDSASHISLEQHPRLQGSLYPIPFSDHLNIPQGYCDRNYELVVYDLSGRVVFRQREVGSRVTLDHLVEGVYVARIFDDQHRLIWRQKLVK
ncbi:MAG: T9SS type A sorting domain-containing protein [Owenweeksia sp.]